MNFNEIASQFPGSCPASAATAAFAALEAGLSRLKQLYLAHDASYGGVAWRTDRAKWRDLRRPDGKSYHYDSITRVGRELAAEGFLTRLRVRAGQSLPAEAKFESSTHGTTVRRLCWSVLGVRNPTTRGQQRRAREKMLSPAERIAARLERPRLSAIIPKAAPPPPKRLGLEALQEKARAAKLNLLQWAAEHESVGGSGPDLLPPDGKPPPD